MTSRKKLVFFALLLLAVILVMYLIAQIIVPEPLTETLTNLANPPTSTAEVLITAYLKNQPENVQPLLARSYRNRIFHLAATEKTVIPPAQALQKHTASFNGYCREKIENENFFLVQTETIDQNRVKCVVYTGTKKSPGTAFLDLVMLKENDGIWRCEQILIHQ